MKVGEVKYMTKIRKIFVKIESSKFWNFVNFHVSSNTYQMKFQINMKRNRRMKKGKGIQGGKIVIRGKKVKEGKRVWIVEWNGGKYHCISPTKLDLCKTEFIFVRETQ